MEWTDEMETECNESREQQWREVERMEDQAFLNWLEHGNAVEQD